MTILLIENPMRSWLWTNGIWIESLKLELQFHAQAQTIQLITTKMFDDILHVSKMTQIFKYVPVCLIQLIYN
jgi:hypothetical protein